MQPPARGRQDHSRRVNAALTWMSARRAVLSERQGGVVGRGQLRDLGIDRAAVAWAVETERWSLWGQRVVVLHNSAPRAAQSWWAAVLPASDGTGEGAALRSGSALQADGASMRDIG